MLWRSAVHKNSNSATLFELLAWLIDSPVWLNDNDKVSDL